MAAVNLLELHWISVQEVLEVTRHVLTRFFIGLWPKKKADMPATDLKKLAVVFDTTEDPILSMKGRSVKQGAEGAIALAYSHGEEVDWEKVSSSHGRPILELWGFFEKAKIRAGHRVHYHSFSGFFDFYSNSFDSCDKWVDASAQRWCYLFCAYFCHGS
jgi:hypothetical protein